MIAQISGALVRTEANSVVLDVNGVGYQVFVPIPVMAALPAVGHKMSLVTHMVLRGDKSGSTEMTLYGFQSTAQSQAFKALLSVSGVGPKVALALLSALDVSRLATALAQNDPRVITQVPGIGPKLAQRLCLEVGDKIAAIGIQVRAAGSDGAATAAAETAAHDDAIEALVGLGYSRQDAHRAADRALASCEDRANTPQLITAALNLLTGRT